MRNLLNVSGLVFFALVFAFALAGPGCATVHTPEPTTPISYETSQPEEIETQIASLPEACDSYRARLVHTPTATSQGTPVFCF